jgi:hypothetical protein
VENDSVIPEILDELYLHAVRIQDVEESDAGTWLKRPLMNGDSFGRQQL